MFLAIDANIELVEEDGVFDVYAYLKKLRQARRGLIETVVRAATDTCRTDRAASRAQCGRTRRCQEAAPMTAQRPRQMWRDRDRTDRCGADDVTNRADRCGT